MRRFFDSPTLRIPEADYRRWVTLSAGLTAIGFTTASIVGTIDPVKTGPNGSRMIAAAVLLIAFGIARRGRSFQAALLTLGTAWAQVSIGFATTPEFPANGMLVSSAIVAVGALLLGPRISLALALVTVATTGPLLRMSPALVATGYTPSVLLWLTIHALVTMAVWSIMSISLTSLERVLREVTDKERDLADTIRNAPDGILLTGTGERVLLANPAAARMLGSSGAMLRGRALDSVLMDLGVPTGLPAGLRGTDAGSSDARGAAVAVPLTVRRDDGTTAHLEITAHRMDGDRRQFMLRDVSERIHADERRATVESRLADAQRLEAIGELASGIAHDFNNLLTAVGGSAEVLRAELVDRAHLALVEDIVSAQERAAVLTRQLLTFARRDFVQPRVFDLSAQVAELEPRLRRALSPLSRLSVAVEPGCLVLADAGRFDEVLMSLVTNAAEAMPDGGVCELRVDSPTDEQGLRSVRLAVRDTGTGMDEATKARVFEPFFTTKSRGRGTGLGLASVHGITLQSGGQVRIDSAPRLGTIVTITLPFATGATTLPAPQVRTPARHSGETILVAEDDEATRRVVYRLLIRAGYDVMLSSDGAHALRAAESNGNRISLLLTDVIMPGLTGPELVRRVRESLPDLPVLFMSGYPAGELAGVPGLRPDLDFIAKPFKTAALLERVAAKIGSSGHSAPAAIAEKGAQSADAPSDG